MNFGRRNLQPLWSALPHICAHWTEGKNWLRSQVMKALRVSTSLLFQGLSIQVAKLVSSLGWQGSITAFLQSIQEKTDWGINPEAQCCWALLVASSIPCPKTQTLELCLSIRIERLLSLVANPSLLLEAIYQMKTFSPKTAIRNQYNPLKGPVFWWCKVEMFLQKTGSPTWHSFASPGSKNS